MMICRFFAAMVCSASIGSAFHYPHLFRSSYTHAVTTVASSWSSLPLLSPFSLGSLSSKQSDHELSGSVPPAPQKPKRTPTPLEMALAIDKPKGRYVNDGWIEEDDVSSNISSFDEDMEISLVSTMDHFAEFERLSEKTFADRFFAIDDEVKGRYRDEGWVSEDEPIPLMDSDFLWADTNEEKARTHSASEDEGR